VNTAGISFLSWSRHLLHASGAWFGVHCTSPKMLPTTWELVDVVVNQSPEVMVITPAAYLDVDLFAAQSDRLPMSWAASSTYRPGSTVMLISLLGLNCTPVTTLLGLVRKSLPE
jgi:hypothetical protein